MSTDNAISKQGGLRGVLHVKQWKGGLRGVLCVQCSVRQDLTFVRQAQGFTDFAVPEGLGNVVLCIRLVVLCIQTCATAHLVLLLVN